MKNQVRDVAELARMVAGSPEMQAKIREDPAGAIAQLAGPLQTDVWIYRFVVCALGLVAIIAIVGTIVLANGANGVPDALISLGSAAVGALAGLLAPAPRG